MIRHIVLFKTKEGHDPAVLKTLVDGFNALPQSIPYVKNFSIGPDISKRGTFNMALSCDFETEAELREYGGHPAHRKLVTEYLPQVAEDRREVVDYTY
ncbi:MAG TPA: Dabb family protein [Chloroflexota bacterium]|nr:Dabb family protein [Chloroflexota bacterium]